MHIKFRGKDFNGVGWVYGDLFRADNRAFIVSKSYIDNFLEKGTFRERVMKQYFDTGIDLIQVDKNTVGQFVGLYDKEGREIYEGDILTNGIHDYLVEWDEDDAQWVYRRARTKHESGQLTLYFDRCKMAEANLVVFMNIHDNPEKLKLWRKSLE